MRIRLLGGLEIGSREGAPIRFATRKSSLLFAALILSGSRGCRREQLSEAFWPGRGDSQARSSLREGRGITIEQLRRYLYEIEYSTKVLRVKELSVEVRFDNKNLMNVRVLVSKFGKPSGKAA